MKLLLDLTTEEAEKLTQVLRDHDDEGPYHSAWRSDEIETLSNKVDSAIAEHSAVLPSVAFPDFCSIGIRYSIIKMLKADTKAGCGFDQDGEWRKAYFQLQKMVEYNELTCVFDPRRYDLETYEAY